MSHSNPVTKHHHHAAGGLERIGSLLAETHPELAISKRRMRKVESIACVRMNRENARQNLGFSSRPFVLCGLPVKRPTPGCTPRTAQWPLRFTGHGAPELRFAVGAGSARPHFSCDSGHPSAVGADYVWQRRRDVGHLRAAAGRFAISPARRVFPEDLRRHNLLRHRRSTGASRRRTPGPV